MGLHKVPNVFPNMFSLVPHFYSIKVERLFHLATRVHFKKLICKLKVGEPKKEHEDKNVLGDDQLTLASFLGSGPVLWNQIARTTA
jgi:hypothetical protein